MCGITGFFNPLGITVDPSTILIKAMSQGLAHRGPDDSGVWVDGNAGIALGHRRLSILDLSPAGHQPMLSASGRFVLIFNGEIYNHLAMRKDIEAFDTVPWRGHSDTETLLAGFECWGIYATLKKTVGMFAIVLWDRHNRELTLARDRMGEKPLYYGWQGDTFLFGSELKALRAHPAFRSEIDRNVLPLYLRHGYIPAPYSIYQGIQKLLPGTFIQLSRRQVPGTLPAPVPYWSLRQVVENSSANPFTGTEEDAIAELEALLMEAVSLQSIADVPLGAFLSGGIDSSLLVALMQAQSSRPVKTFTIGFDEKGYNEAEHAKAVAKHLGTDHTEMYVTPRDAMEVIPKLPTLYDEPFGDSSQIPTFLVSQMTRQYVKVALSGDGGDELFGGYGRYFSASSMVGLISPIPGGIRRLASKTIRTFSPEFWSIALNLPLIALKGRRPNYPPGETAYSYARYLDCVDDMSLYRELITQWPDSDIIVGGATELDTVLSTPMKYDVPHALEEGMMYADGLTYLPDDILAKVDRAAMGVSLETRIPMLDHRVIELAWRLPMKFKMYDGQGKRLLRQVLYKHVPKLLIDRPKMGFGVPVDDWIRGPLRDWAEEMLSIESLSMSGFRRADIIRKRWDQHIKGKANWKDPLWVVLAFQAWHKDLQH